MWSFFYLWYLVLAIECLRLIMSIFRLLSLHTCFLNTWTIYYLKLIIDESSVLFCIIKQSVISSWTFGSTHLNIPPNLLVRYYHISVVVRLRVHSGCGWCSSSVSLSPSLPLYSWWGFGWTVQVSENKLEIMLYRVPISFFFYFWQLIQCLRDEDVIVLDNQGVQISLAFKRDVKSLGIKSLPLQILTKQEARELES